jgi:hypothetical protein
MMVMDMVHVVVTFGSGSGCETVFSCRTRLAICVSAPAFPLFADARVMVDAAWIYTTTVGIGRSRHATTRLVNLGCVGVSDWVWVTRCG